MTLTRRACSCLAWNAPGPSPRGLRRWSSPSSTGPSRRITGLSQLAAWTREPDLLEALRLNADYYARTQYDSGRWPHFVERAPDSICGYATAWGAAGLIIAYEALGNAQYLASAEKGLAAFLEGAQPDGAVLCHCNHAGGDREDNHAIRASLTMLTPFALAYRVTGKHAYRAAGVRLADFLVRTQLLMDDPRFDGAWPGSFNVAKDFPGGDIDDEGNLFDLYTSWGAAPIVYGLQRLAPHCRRVR